MMYHNCHILLYAFNLLYANNIFKSAIVVAYEICSMLSNIVL